jgi:hypothetical protein
MASTALGERLTAAHGQTQAQLRARFLQQLLVLMPLWSGDRESFARLITATVPLVQLRNRDSAALALAYFRAFRAAELGAATAAAGGVMASAPAVEQVATSMWVTGQTQFARSLSAGLGQAQARQQAFTRLALSTSRHVLDGGRQTVIESTRRDDQAVGWQWVTTSAKPCPWCIMQSGRGGVFKSRESVFNADEAKMRSHDGCLCKSEPVYTAGAEGWSDQALAHRALYQRAQREARERGETTNARVPQLANLERLMRREGLRP